MRDHRRRKANADRSIPRTSCATADSSARVVAVGTYESFELGGGFEAWRVMGAPGSVSVISGSHVGITSTAGVLYFTSHTGRAEPRCHGRQQHRDRVEQTLSTQPAETYELSFWIGHAGDFARGLDSKIDVLIDGVHAFSGTNDTAIPNELSWEQLTTTFVATSATTTIAFVSADFLPDSSNLLDDITVRHVEP